MNTSDLSIKELAAFIGVSTDSIRRAVRKDEIPATRVKPRYGLIYRKSSPVCSGTRRPGLGHARRARWSARAARAQADQPPSGKTGAQFR